jgi:hypothetical protein
MMRTKQQPCRTVSDKGPDRTNFSGAKCLKTLERVKGIEPSYSAWKAAALPLSYTRVRDRARPRNVPLTWPTYGLNCPGRDNPLPKYLSAGAARTWMSTARVP